MYNFHVFALLSLFAAQTYLLLGVYAFFKNSKAGANRLFLLVAVSMAVWGLGEGMQRAAADAATADFWANFVVGIGSALHPALIMHFWLAFSGRLGAMAESRKIWLLLAVYAPSFIFSVLRFFFPQIMVRGVVPEYWGYSSTGGAVYQLFMLYVAAYLGMLVFFMLRSSRRSPGDFGRQARNMGIGILIPLIIGFFTQAFRPVLGLAVPELSVSGAIVFISITAYTISRYRMFAITTEIVAENIVATMNDYVIATDRNLKIALVNDSALNNLGYGKNGLIGAPMEATASFRTASFGYENLRERLPAANVEVELKRNGGGKVPVAANVSALVGHENETVGFVFVMRDMRETNKLIGDLKKKNEEVEAKNEELERFNKLAVGRELKMIELKEKIARLEKNPAE